jgi:hypothetical protein
MTDFITDMMRGYVRNEGATGLHVECRNYACDSRMSEPVEKSSDPVESGRVLAPAFKARLLSEDWQQNREGFWFCPKCRGLMP